jgi:hypothetical protein
MKRIAASRSIARLTSRFLGKIMGDYRTAARVQIVDEALMKRFTVSRRHPCWHLSRFGP